MVGGRSMPPVLRRPEFFALVQGKEGAIGKIPKPTMLNNSDKGEAGMKKSSQERSGEWQRFWQLPHMRPMIRPRVP